MFKPFMTTIFTRYTDLQNEAVECSKRNFALELKWSELRGIDECETLYKVTNINFFWHFKGVLIFKEGLKAKCTFEKESI